jgi:hypothetical protein
MKTSPCLIKQQKFIVAQFWELEVQNLSVGRAMLFWKRSGKDLLQVSLLDSGSSVVPLGPCGSIIYLPYSILHVTVTISKLLSNVRTQ